MNRLVVSTECPSCGAPLDFSEGVNAITCGHCKTNLLVTGRKQVLSYYVGPQLDERIAVAKATMAQRNRGYEGFSEIRSWLYFIPYYRMTGQEFDLAETPALPPIEEEDRDVISDLEGDHSAYGFQGGPSLLNIAADLVNTFLDKTLRKDSRNDQEPYPNESHAEKISPSGAEVIKKDPLTRGSLYEKGEALLNDRYVEKSFLACNLYGLNIYSLGVRPAVLRLELFRGERLRSLGKVVNPSLGVEEAERIGMKTALDASLLNRLVVGRVLSLIYFPFYLVKMKSKGENLVTIVDAVSKAVIKADAPESIYEILNSDLAEEPKVIGFRPLTCPNCGWDFPVRPDDMVFFCSTCSKAWQICGSELSEVKYQVAKIQPLINGVQQKYLPFFVFQKVLKDGQPFSFYIPVFRYRRLKILLNMAVRFSRCRPSYSFADTAGAELFGCYYDEEDAYLLAQFTESALESGSIQDFKASDNNSNLTGATLTWFPFQVRGEYLLAPFCNTSIPRNLLI